LRTLLIVAVLLSVALGWLGIVAERTRQQKKTLERFRKYGPLAEFRFGNVVGLTLTDPDQHGPDYGGDDDLLHLKELTQLECLTIECHNVTEDGLSQLEHIRLLKRLDLYELRITDSGMDSLKKLNNLEELYLLRADVGEADIEELQKALPKCLMLCFQSHHPDRPKQLTPPQNADGSGR